MTSFAGRHVAPRVAFFALVLCIGCGFYPVASTAEDAPTPPQSSSSKPNLSDPGTVDAGRALFTGANCGLCHGADGTGGVRLVGNTLDADRAHDTIANGRIHGNMRMPSWKGVFTDDQIWQLTAYVLSLK